MIPGDILSAFPHRQFHTLPCLLDSWAALQNTYPNACMPMHGGSLYHFYDGLWYDPTERRTHDLPCERRTRYRPSHPHTVNFLGTTINKHMNWKHHVNKLSSKINRTIGILNRLKHFLPTKVKLSIYNSLILSQLHFSILTSGFSLEKTIKLQKRVMRVVSNSKYNSHTEPLFKKLKLLKLTDIFNCQQIKFYHKYLNNKLPVYFTDIFTRLNDSTHNYSTRNRDDISFERVKHEYVQKNN